MWQWNYQMWEKNKGIIECYKSTVTWDVSTDQCEYGTVKWEKKDYGIIKCDKSTARYDVNIV